MQKSTVIFMYKCDRVECDDEWYTGESAMNILERLKEHFKTLIYDHCNITGHPKSLDNFSIVGRESHNLARTIKEAIHISANDPSLNKNIGK